MNRAFEKELSRALATELDTAAPKTLLRRCRSYGLYSPDSPAPARRAPM